MAIEKELRRIINKLHIDYPSPFASSFLRSVKLLRKMSKKQVNISFRNVDCGHINIKNYRDVNTVKSHTSRYFKQLCTPVKKQ